MGTREKLTMSRVCRGLARRLRAACACGLWSRRPLSVSSSDQMSYLFLRRSMSSNAERYPGPDTFYPERFLKEGDSLNDDTVGYAFGFGRRICPGRYLAENSLFIAFCSILHVFNISKALDKEGREVLPEARWFSGVVA